MTNQNPSLKTKIQQMPHANTSKEDVPENRQETKPVENEEAIKTKPGAVSETVEKTPINNGNIYEELAGLITGEVLDGVKTMLSDLKKELLTDSTQKIRMEGVNKIYKPKEKRS